MRHSIISVRMLEDLYAAQEIVRDEDGNFIRAEFGDYSVRADWYGREFLGMRFVTWGDTLESHVLWADEPFYIMPQFRGSPNVLPRISTTIDPPPMAVIIEILEAALKKRRDTAPGVTLHGGPEIEALLRRAKYTQKRRQEVRDAKD